MRPSLALAALLTSLLLSVAASAGAYTDERQEEVQAILDALFTYAQDHDCRVPAGIQPGRTYSLCAATDVSTCGTATPLTELVPTSIPEIPRDPVLPDGPQSGYYIELVVTGSIRVFAGLEPTVSRTFPLPCLLQTYNFSSSSAPASSSAPQVSSSTPPASAASTSVATSSASQGTTPASTGTSVSSATSSSSAPPPAVVSEAGDIVLGNERAPVTVVEYGSFAPGMSTDQSVPPACLERYEMLRGLADQGRVKWVVRLRTSGAQTTKLVEEEAIRRLECVRTLGDEQAFWDGLSFVCTTPNYTQEDFEAFATSLGLDLEALRTCTGSPSPIPPEPAAQRLVVTKAGSPDAEELPNFTPSAHLKTTMQEVQIGQGGNINVRQSSVIGVLLSLGVAGVGVGGGVLAYRGRRRGGVRVATGDDELPQF